MSKYTDAVANAFSEAKAWRTATLFLMLICGVLAFSLIYQSRTTPVILVPAGYDTAKGPMKVVPSKDFAEASPDYLAQIALGDLALILNWIPDDVELQHQRFLNRMTPELYAEQNVTMMQQAAEYKSNSTSQSFYPNSTKVGTKGQVVIEGTLVRWTGEKESVRVRVSYTITYSKYKGYAHVASLKINSGK